MMGNVVSMWVIMVSLNYGHTGNVFRIDHECNFRTMCAFYYTVLFDTRVKYSN